MKPQPKRSRETNQPITTEKSASKPIRQIVIDFTLYEKSLDPTIVLLAFIADQIRKITLEKTYITEKRRDHLVNAMLEIHNAIGEFAKHNIT